MRQFKKIGKPTRMPEAIVREIEDRLLRGEYKPGDSLPSEAELMELFGVGKYTVREALRMLEASGFVKVKQGSRRGPVITSPTTSLVSDFLRKALFVGNMSEKHITQFRLALELSIIDILGSSPIKQEWLSKLENSIREAKENYSKGEELVDISSRFHVLLAEATGNPMFVVLVNTLMNTSIVLNLVAPFRHQLDAPTIEHHEAILEALKSGDAVRARTIMQQHLLEIDDVWKT
jgi:DNA-binding FadR family transcriptional regulator